MPEPQLSLTPLLACIYWRKLKTFLNATLTLLSSELTKNDESDVLVIVDVFRSRILPEVEALPVNVAADIRSSVVRVVIEILCVCQGNHKEYFLMHFCDWYQNKPDWKTGIEETISQLVSGTIPLSGCCLYLS